MFVRSSKTDAEDGDDRGYVETDPTGRYSRFKKVLGKGAMKIVYQAIDEVLGMEVAWSQVKLNDLLQAPDDLQRLYSEVHLLSTLNHDSIIKFYTSWIDIERRTFNFITEMFTSGNLREYRRRYNRVEIGAIKIWARQILSGLVYLHGHDPPVIHRDLKCDNIFVNGHLGQIKIGDLGLAAILRRSCRAHSIIGTPEFMAPELYEENYNELVDVYSFGMCVLEMLTHEYPYSECKNPAQIYKKVTSGKLPRAFYKVQDLDAQRFIGKCLATASKRLSAKDLMFDPFLATDKSELLPIDMVGDQKPFINDEIAIETLQLNGPRTNMTITGKMNPEDDTIFLKVQIADKEGSVRNVFFPFDILIDTPDEVASEMVKELEITDWEPSDIADMIEGEISGLVPHWKWDPPKSDNFHALGSHEDEDEHNYPFYSPPSSSSQVSCSDMTSSHRTDERARGGDWLQDYLCDDTSSQGSVVSGTYSNLSYHSGEDHEPLLSPIKRNHLHHSTVSAHNSPTRFGHEERVSSDMRSSKNSGDRQPNGAVTPEPLVASTSEPRLTRNRSLVDMQSQLLHRSLVEEVNKRCLSKTVGAVEDVGFQAPCLDIPRKSGKLLRAVGSMKITSGSRPGDKGRRV